MRFLARAGLGRSSAPYLFAALAMITAPANAASTKNEAIVFVDGAAKPDDAVPEMLEIAAKRARQAGFNYFGVISAQFGQSYKAGHQSGNIGGGGSVDHGGLGPVYSLTARIRFLSESELPANRDGIYDVTRLLGGGSR